MSKGRPFVSAGPDDKVRRTFDDGFWEKNSEIEREKKRISR